MIRCLPSLQLKLKCNVYSVHFSNLKYVTLCHMTIRKRTGPVMVWEIPNIFLTQIIYFHKLSIKDISFIFLYCSLCTNVITSLFPAKVQLIFGTKLTITQKKFQVLFLNHIEPKVYRTDFQISMPKYKFLIHYHKLLRCILTKIISFVQRFQKIEKAQKHTSSEKETW